MIRKLFLNGPIGSITGAAAVIAFSSFVSRILGLFRDRVLAGEFGAGPELDIYYAAFRIPDFIYNLLIFGSLSAAFIPLFATYLTSPNDRSEGFRFANVVLSTGVVIVLPIVCAGILFAPIITKLFVAPGFSQEAQATTVLMTRIMFLSPVLLGVSGLVGSILQSFRRFFVYSLAPIFYNIGIIAGALFITPYLGVIGLAWGVVLGAFLHLLIQLPSLYGLGFAFRFLPNFKHEMLKTFVRLMAPRSLNLFIVQLNLIVVTIIASHLASGSITIFNFANNIQSFPVGIIGISFAVAAFPTLAQHIANGEKEKFIESLAKAMNEILFFILPLTVLIIALRAQIVRVLLGTGAFNWEDTIMTFETLGLFTVSLFAQSITPLLLRAFYAVKNTTIPLLISIGTLLLNVALSMYLVFFKSLDVQGLALAFSLSSIVGLILLWIALRLYVGYLRDWSIMVSSLKIIVSSIAMVPFIQFAKRITAGVLSTDTFVAIFLQGALSLIVGVLVYLTVSFLLRSEELSVLYATLRRHLIRMRAGVDISEGREV